MTIHNGIQYKLSVFIVCINLTEKYTESDKGWEQLADVCAETLPHIAKSIRIGNVVSIIAVLGSIPEVLHLITV